MLPESHLRKVHMKSIKMAPPSISLIENLSTKDIEKLTELLRLPPGKLPSQVWLKDQASRVSKLPSRLLKPNAPLLRLGMSLNIGPDKATLCKSHKRLNPYLIRRIFLQISAECTTRLTRLVENLSKDTEIELHVKRLQIVNSLWMSTDLYRVTFRVMPQDPRFFRIPGDCEACILAAVGGSPHTLVDLRSAMLGRKRKRCKEPRLVKLVEAWLKWTGFGPKLSEESDKLARVVRARRREMQLERREKLKDEKDLVFDDLPPYMHGAMGSETLVPEDGSDERFPLLPKSMSEADSLSPVISSDQISELLDESPDDEEVDLASEIIDRYANSIRSSTPLLRRPAREDDIHPAYRNSTMLSREGPSTAARPATPRPSPSSQSTSYASITTDPLSAERLERLNSLPPRPERPQNRSTYMDSMASARMSRASAPIPPLRTRSEPAAVYTESEYSRDIYGRRSGDATSMVADHLRRVNEERARAYAELMRRQAEEEVAAEGNPRNLYEENEIEVEAPPIPRRDERRRTTRSDFAERRVSHQDGW